MSDSEPHQRIIEQSRRPLAEHLAEYRAAQLAKGNGQHHANDTHKRACRMIELCRASYYSDLSDSTIRGGIEELKAAQAYSITSVNQYLFSLSAFCNWMVNDDRADRNPCRRVKPDPVASSDLRRRRRPLYPVEFPRLLDAAMKAEPVYGIPGEERALKYLLATHAGLTPIELKNITPRSFALDGDRPHVVVWSRYTNPRQQRDVYLCPEIVGHARTYFAKVSPDHPLFATDNGEGLRADLQAARIDHCADGKYVDFLSLSQTFARALVLSGATPKAMQTRLGLQRYEHARKVHAQISADGASQAPVQTRRGRGRHPRINGAQEKQRLEILAAWAKAVDAGISPEKFCADRHKDGKPLTAKGLKRIVVWAANRKRREREKGFQNPAN